MSKLAMPLLGARVVGNHLREKVRPVRVTSAAETPPSVDAITPQWLTAVLCAGVPNAAVTAFEVVGGSDGTSSRRALQVHYNAAGCRGEPARAPVHEECVQPRVAAVPGSRRRDRDRVDLLSAGASAP